jgi:hypothetical protein
MTNPEETGNSSTGVRSSKRESFVALFKNGDGNKLLVTDERVESRDINRFKVAPDVLAVIYADSVTVTLEDGTVTKTRSFAKSGMYFIEGAVIGLADLADKLGTLEAATLWEELGLHPKKDRMVQMKNGMLAHFRSGTDRIVYPCIYVRVWNEAYEMREFRVRRLPKKGETPRWLVPRDVCWQAFTRIAGNDPVSTSKRTFVQGELWVTGMIVPKFGIGNYHTIVNGSFGRSDLLSSGQNRETYYVKVGDKWWTVSHNDELPAYHVPQPPITEEVVPPTSDPEVVSDSIDEAIVGAGNKSALDAVDAACTDEGRPVIEE